MNHVDISRCSNRGGMMFDISGHYKNDVNSSTFNVFRQLLTINFVASFMMEEGFVK